ncbi:hypothetical protein N7481_000488 [Penicillium waksmanii]|uniref:uncharacterized protein n=1 Tax=Penicillium waksmanii TaxID=69791 RepID=UPI0025481F43|nr:uncharacterized protein N7481_000488 [Penicillium waksmanii]KAJ6000079.1 hypothetical protein N7481_000488 [Penicillium waksmanii]
MVETSSYGQGTLRYFFFHGNHGDVPLPRHLTVEANVVVFNGKGEILFGQNFDKGPSCYEFQGGFCRNADGQVEDPLPAKSFVEKIMKNISVPSLILAEVPKAILVLGRSDIRPCTAGDREYLSVMMKTFVPRMLRVMAPTASEYLPGDAHNVCVGVADRMEMLEDDPDYHTFIAMYRGRYVQKPLPRRAVVELCLLHVLKMPFELNTSIKSSLIRY